MDDVDARVPSVSAETVRAKPVSLVNNGYEQERNNVILALLLVAQFMAVIDVTIVNVSAPSIRSGLHTSDAMLQLIVAGYTVVYSTFLITGARLGDRYGHARVFLVGLVGFTVMSLSCGIAPDPAVLVVSRLMQGAAAALMMPQVMSLIQRTFQGPERVRAVSIYGAVIAIGAVFGQIVGGLLVSANILNLGWRPVFLVNVPIGLVLSVLVLMLMHRPKGDADRGFDPIGVITIMATVVCLVVPIVFGQELRWPSWLIAMLVLVVPLAAFGSYYERHTSDRDPIISSAIATAPGFGWALLFMLLMQSSYGGTLFVMSLHFESGLGLSALHTGLLFIAGGSGFAVGSLTWRKLPTRLHPSLLYLGMLVGAVGYAVIGLTLRDGHQPGVVYGIASFILSAAFGYSFGPVLAMALSRVPLKFAGSASGIFVSTFQLGQLLGIAVYGSIYFALDHAGSAASSAPAFGETLALAALACVVGAAAGWMFVRSAAVKAKSDAA